MTLRHRLASLRTSIIAGTFAQLAAAAPALAAPPFSLPFDITSIGGRDLLLFGSIALLVVALAIKIVRDRHHAEPAPDGSDLRWWKNPPNPQS